MRKYAHTSIFMSLPVELVDEIAWYSAPLELYALCLVSKQAREIAARRLYHTIVLENMKNAVLCFRTLSRRQNLANCVRRIVIDLLKHNKHKLFENFFKLAAAALRQTTNLIGLEISGLGPLLSLLAATTFPRLAEVKLPYAPAITRFLQANHQLLKAIVIEGPSTPDALKLSGQHFKNVHLPELSVFVGPCNVIPHVVPGSQVQYLTVCWEPEYEQQEEIVRCIARSRQEVLGMDNLVFGWNPVLLSIIAQCMPRMERLRIRNICPLATRQTIEDYLLYIEEGLPKFKRLHTLAITLLFYPYKYALADLDQEYEFLRRWGTLMPTLMVCTLPSLTRWTRFKDSHWFPVVDPKVDTHRKLKIHWLFRAFRNEIYPSELFAMISGGIKFEDVVAMVDTGYFLEGDDVETIDSDWDWEDEEDSDSNWVDGDDDGISNGASSGEGGSESDNE